MADPLHTISRHGVQWLGNVHGMATFVLFCQNFGGKILMKMDNLIPEKTKRQASQTQDSRKRSNINDFYTYASRVKRDCLKCAVLCYTLSQSVRRKILFKPTRKGDKWTMLLCIGGKIEQRIQTAARKRLRGTGLSKQLCPALT